MATSLRKPAIPSRTCRRTAWLCLLLGTALLAGRTAAADDRVEPQARVAAGALNEDPAPGAQSTPARLPPIALASYDAASDAGQTLPGEGEASSNAFSDGWRLVDDPDPPLDEPSLQPLADWLDYVSVGYDEGFVIASGANLDLQASDAPFRMQLNGWGQLRHALLDSKSKNSDLNQFQLKRARLVFSGAAFSSDLHYFGQLDGRSSSGDDVRLLDYFFAFDFGRHLWGLERGVLGVRAGKYKIPFTFARELSGREFEFTDRSMASTFFDVNRSFGWSVFGQTACCGMPVRWEAAIFNGLVTGGAETGSAGTLDANFAYSARISIFPTGDWGSADLADLDWHDQLATRMGAAFASSTIDRSGTTEFNSIRVVDSGKQLSSLLPPAVVEYDVSTCSFDWSCKLRGWSWTAEYYLRNISGFRGAAVPDLFDHGFWLQCGKFVVPEKLQVLSRWSRVVGESGTLGAVDQSADEIAGGLVWYYRRQHAKLTLDITHLDGAPIASPSLDISPGDKGWLFRTQLQVAF